MKLAFEEVTGELARLIRQINATNVATNWERGLTLADALAERDIFKLKHGVCPGWAKIATSQQQ